MELCTRKEKFQSCRMKFRHIVPFQYRKKQIDTSAQSPEAASEHSECVISCDSV